MHLAGDAWAPPQGWSRVQHSSGATFFHKTEREANGRVASPAPVVLGIRRDMAQGRGDGGEGVGLLSHYLLDGASPLPALVLAAKPGHRVLDLCAAPGGKSLVLAGQLFAPSSASSPSVLEANDKSETRRVRLCRVLREYLPASLLHLSPHCRGVSPSGGVVVRGFSCAGGSRRLKIGGVGGWGGGLNFDRILVDAPCSSERQFVHAWAEGGRGGGGWSKRRLKADAKIQFSLVMQALALLNPNGGELVYCTCSIAPEENDAVIEKVLKACGGRGARFAVELVDPLQELYEPGGEGRGGEELKPRVGGIGDLLKGVERSKFGAIMLPDVSRFGPLFWTKLRKTRAPAFSFPTALGRSQDDVPSSSSSDAEDEGEGRQGEPNRVVEDERRGDERLQGPEDLA